MLLLVIALFLCSQVESTPIIATALLSGSSVQIVPGHSRVQNAVAWASYEQTQNQTGWNILKINTTENGNFTDSQKHYVAGFIEGYFTWSLMFDYYVDFFQDLMGNLTTEQLNMVYNFTLKNDEWIQEQIQAHNIEGDSEQSYWNQIQLVMSEIQGLADASAKYATLSQQVSRLQILLENMDGDLFDIIPGITGVDTDLYVSERHQRRKGHCTSFIRFSGDELYCAHNTWDSYQTMVRIFKHYRFPSSDPSVQAPNVLMSSYPACLSSVDDFYVLSSGLFVTETTNNNYNMSLYRLLTPASVFSWARVVIANRLANSSESWARIYSMYNSGTYNNQWVVVDHNLFTPSMPYLLPNTVWVLEQIPGYIEAADVTEVVNQQGYWGGFNVPYFPYIYDVMGYPAAVQQFGLEVSRNCSRAKIFERDANDVESIEDMKTIMQYNEWQTDPLSSNDSCNSIAARCDLAPSFDLSCSGALDAKVTSHKDLRKMKAWAIGGPTHQTQAPFVWSASPCPDQLHEGQPDEYKFYWMMMH